MSIPLVQNNEKDSINTSIIAIKRNIERINMLLGLVDSGSPDLSGLATKQELQDAITELTPVDEVTSGNMQSVSSNAVAVANSYSTSETFTGRYWIDGKKIYRKCFSGSVTSTTQTISHGLGNTISDVVDIKAVIKISGLFMPFGYYNVYNGSAQNVSVYINSGNLILLNTYTGGTYKIIFEYTKTTD